jgi:type II secretory pathway predicted ATPase ExeA
MAVPRTQFYHPARVIDGALHAIDRAIRRAEGISLVVGPPGTGKSLLLAKVGESVAEDFRVALLSGARICTRRALWQSILVDLGKPYRGIDEAELRIAVAEVVRELAATGSGLVILVDEAHTLPLRLIEELRLLANTPTPLPAVHIVLAGPTALEERLATPKLESLSQRIAVRSYLEPLDHSEAVAYLRTQTKAAGLDWDKCFEPGCADAVYGIADGVPRLMNQLCDQAIVLVADAGRRVKPSDIAAAWQEIQKLPSPALFGHLVSGETCHDTTGSDAATEGGRSGSGIEDCMDDAVDGSDDGAVVREHGGESGVGVIEFGSLDDQPGDGTTRLFADLGGILDREDEEPVRVGQSDPWHGPDVEFVFDASTDPFQEFFEQEERIVERYLMRSPDDFSRHQHVASCEGAALVRQLAELAELADRRPGTAAAPVGGRTQSGVSEQTGGISQPPPEPGPLVVTTAAELDDSDMVVIEEDLLAQSAGKPVVAAVRLGDYRRLFARLRRGG